MDFITELNKQNAYGERVGRVQLAVRENYKAMSAKDIYNKACEINSYTRPTLSCVIPLHYALIELINIIYKLRDVADTALDYCLLMCDMDIALYDDVQKATIKESHSSFVFAGSLSRKIIILEKHGEYQEAIRLCDLAISKGYKNAANDENSNSFVKQKNRIMNKLAKTPAKDTISKPKQ
ncbi:MAG: hypothetical protein K2M89_06180 [Clostridiales bacterium]|nr:hypothetical protein [Clostridiales bacterium]